ncbi:hypothetical protein RB195_011818 [Necator americanus]|uniref:Uncharacterized protein n=1 Tax=Necator americanus TaxID=51031 RepID=A0ABR1D5G4_NECAM
MHYDTRLGPASKPGCTEFASASQANNIGWDDLWEEIADEVTIQWLCYKDPVSLTWEFEKKPRRSYLNLEDRCKL